MGKGTGTSRKHLLPAAPVVDDANIIRSLLAMHSVTSPDREFDVDSSAALAAVQAYVAELSRPEVVELLESATPKRIEHDLDVEALHARSQSLDKLRARLQVLHLAATKQLDNFNSWTLAALSESVSRRAHRAAAELKERAARAYLRDAFTLGAIWKVEVALPAALLLKDIPVFAPTGRAVTLGECQTSGPNYTYIPILTYGQLRAALLTGAPVYAHLFYQGSGASTRFPKDDACVPKVLLAQAVAAIGTTNAP